jgi:succinate dehydrogenase / fumarate reductase membrane anchor subunit
MVTSITSLTGNGLKDWWIQRATAVFLAIYGLFLLTFLCMHPHLEFSAWRALFNCRVVQAATIMSLFFLLLHAWVGLWTVTTDYLTCTALRVVVQWAILLVLIAQLIYGGMILWGHCA